MFSALETTWDQSARRGWSTAASFTAQAIGLSFLLLVPLVTVQGPPQIFTRFADHWLAPPAPQAPPTPPGPRHTISGSEVRGTQIVEPTSYPIHAMPIVDNTVPDAPNLGDIGVDGGTGGPDGRGGGIAHSIGIERPIAVTTTAVTNHPIRISNWAEGGLVRRVQPVYPPLARQARIQGAVQLRAIISRSGTIEDLKVLGGHAMLVGAAVEAVKQWRYRPYLLNGEPIEVETEITVNFTLAGN